MRHRPTIHRPIVIACCGLLGKLDEGRKWVQRLLAVHPDASLSSLRTVHQLILKKPESREALLGILRTPASQP